jgi:transposase-like protein
LRAPGASVPDGRTIRRSPSSYDRDISTAILIPVTNAIESLHRGLRKIIKTRGSFPSDEAAMKLLYLAMCNLGVHWKPAIEWRAAFAQFAIFFLDRLPTNTLR